MPRSPVVTRTIISTKVVAVCLDISTNEATTHEYELSGTYKTIQRMVNHLNRFQLKGTNYKALDIIDFEVEKKLYGVSEQEFLNIAHEIPARKLYPRHRKED